VSRILREADDRAYQLLVGHREELERLTETLIEREVLTVTEIEELIGKRARPPYVEPDGEKVTASAEKLD
jgi:cell division protease FtsH